MEQLLELLMQIEELAGMGIDALEGAMGGEAGMAPESDEAAMAEEEAMAAEEQYA